MLDFEPAASLVLDVRNPDEYAGELGHITGSLLIPVTQLAHRLGELQKFRGRHIICICKSGGRSHTAAGVLMQAHISVRRFGCGWYDALERIEVSNHKVSLDRGEGSPLLEQEGWLRIKKISRSSFESADGVVSPE